MMTLIADLRQAVSVLRREPWFAAGTIAALVLAATVAVLATGAVQCEPQSSTLASVRVHRPFAVPASPEQMQAALRRLSINGEKVNRTGMERKALEERLRPLRIFSAEYQKCLRTAAMEAHLQSVAASLTEQCIRLLEKVALSMMPEAALSTRTISRSSSPCGTKAG